MKPDLRFLIFLNAVLFAIACLAVFTLLTLAPPRSDFTENIERIGRSPSVGSTVESAGMIAKIAMRRAETIKEERKLAAILGGFAGFVGVTNLYFMIILYRQLRRGACSHDAVELQKT